MAKREKKGQNGKMVVRKKEKEGNRSYWRRTMLVSKQISVKIELKEMKKDHCSPMLSLQLTQKKLERERENSKKKRFMLQILRKAAKAEKQGTEGHERRPGKAQKSRP